MSDMLAAQLGADTIRFQVYWSDYQTGVNQYDKNVLDAIIARVQTARANGNNAGVKALINFDLPGGPVAWMQTAGYGLETPADDDPGNPNLPGKGDFPRWYPTTAAGLQAYGQAAGKALKYLYDAGVADYLETANEPNLAHGISDAIPAEKVGQLGGNAVNYAALEGLQLNSITGPAVLIGSVAIRKNASDYYKVGKYPTVNPNAYPTANEYFGTVQYYADITIDQWWADKPGGPPYAVTLKGTWRPSFHSYPDAGGTESTPCQVLGSGKNLDHSGDLTGDAAYNTVKSQLDSVIGTISSGKKWWLTETGMTSYKTNQMGETVGGCQGRRGSGGDGYGRTQQSNFYSNFVTKVNSLKANSGYPWSGFEGVTFFQPQDVSIEGGQFAGYGLHWPGSASNCGKPYPCRKPAADTFEQYYGTRWAIDNLGGNVTSDTDISSWGYGRLDMFAKGALNDITHMSYEGTFSPWESLGNSPASGPGAVSWGPNRIDVVARAADGSVLHPSWNGSVWFTDNLGGSITFDPDISSWGYGRLDIFARGVSGDLVHKRYDGNWSGWESLGGSLVGGPGAVSWGPNRIDVVGRAPDNTVNHWSWNGTKWVIDNLGGNITSDPDISSWGYGRLDVFAKGTKSDLVHKSYDGFFSNWESLGGSLTSGPGAVSWGPGRIDVIGRAANNTVTHWALD